MRRALKHFLKEIIRLLLFALCARLKVYERTMDDIHAAHIRTYREQENI